MMLVGLLLVVLGLVGCHHQQTTVQDCKNGHCREVK